MNEIKEVPFSACDKNNRFLNEIPDPLRGSDP
jgi:hypothetical protein